MHNILSKRSIRELQQKHLLGHQNDSRCLGPKKLLKIVNCATIKETGKLKETMVGVQVDLAGGHQYPLRSQGPTKNLNSTNTCHVPRLPHHPHAMSLATLVIGPTC